MDERSNNLFLIILLSVIFIAVIFITNIFLSRPIHTAKFLTERGIETKPKDRHEIQPKNPQSLTQTPAGEEECEPPLGNGPLLN